MAQSDGSAVMVLNMDDCESNEIAYDIEAIPCLTEGNLVGVNARGLSVFMAALFIIGEIAGAGVLALPNAINGMGWIGVLLIIVVCLASIYTGTLLGTAWSLVQQRYPEYRGLVRYPYPAIGQVSYGNKGRITVSIFINVTLYGASIVFMILAAQNIHLILSNYTKLPFCYILLAVAAILIPATWLGTPKDFWFFALGATGATLVACIVLLAEMVLDVYRQPSPSYDNPTFLSFATAFGTILFAFGGHPAFPTFQTDMKIQKKFRYAVGIAFTFIAFIYLPIAAVGYAVYGSRTRDNVLLNLTGGSAHIAIAVLITCHLLFAYTLVFNTVCQDIEELTKVPPEFTWKRVLCRTLLVGTGLFIAETIPRFGVILSLVGGTTTNLLAFILPIFFYSKLCSMEGDWPPIHLPLHIRVLNYEIMFVALLGGIASTYAAVVTLASPSSVTVPCFVNITAN